MNETIQISYENKKELVHETIRAVRNYRKQGLSSIAVVCPDDDETLFLKKELDRRIETEGLTILAAARMVEKSFDGIVQIHAPVSRTAASKEAVKPAISSDEPAAAAVPAPQMPVSATPKAVYTRKRVKISHHTPAADNLTKSAHSGNSSVLNVKIARAKFVPPKRTLRDEPVEKVVCEYMQPPEGTSLKPIGHNRIDTAIRWVIREKHYLDLQSSYGMLRICPIDQDTVRVCFISGQQKEFPAAGNQFPSNPAVNYEIQETPKYIRLILPKLTVHAEKQTGALSFFDSNNTLLIKERDTEPRQLLNSSLKKSWIFFQWEKRECLTAVFEDMDQEQVMGTAARYISYGEKSQRLPLLRSSKGYELYAASPGKVLCCTVATYGPYLCFEESGIIDYYIRKN